MKGKVSSSHHRMTNTYKFQTFSERLGDVHVDVARRVNKLASTPEDADTFFGQSLRKWSELNYTQHFVDFKRTVAGTVYSFTQLIHHQEKIVSALLEHLQVPDSLAYQPLLDLVVQVARDLQSDFYPYFKDVLPVLVGLLQVHDHDTDILEQTFTCLSYLFKFLWRAMVSNITDVYKLVSPLLSNHYREYINNFASESFAFLMRKVKDFSGLCDVMFKDLYEHPDQIVGIGRLLFETVKGVQKGLHTVAGKVVPVLLGKLGNNDLPTDEVCLCLRSMFNSIAAVTDKTNTPPIWTPLLCQIGEVHLLCGEAIAPESSGPIGHLRRLLELLLDLVHYKKGLLVVPVTELTQVLMSLLKGPTLPGAAGECLLRAISELVMASQVTLSYKHQMELLQRVYASDYSVPHLLAFTRAVLDMPMFEKDVLPPLLVFSAKCLLKGGEDQDAATHILAELIVHKAPSPAHGEEVEEYTTYLLDFGSVSSRCPGSKDVPKKLVQILTKLTNKMSTENLASIWSLVLCIPHIRPLEGKGCTKLLKRLYSCVIEYAKDGEDNNKDAALCIATEVIWALIKKTSSDDFFEIINHSDVTELMRTFGGNVHALRLVAIYYTWASLSGDPISDEYFKDILPNLVDNFSSPEPRVRLLTLQICSQADLPMPTREEDEGDSANCLGLFNICLAAEKVEITVHTYRTKLVHLAKLEHSIVHNLLPVGDYHTVALRYLIGQLYMNFAFMWDPVIELIQTYAVNMKPVTFWEIFESHLVQLANITEAAGYYLETGVKAKTHRSSALCVPAAPTLEGTFSSCQHVLVSPGRIDHFNCRKLLWRCMQNFPRVCEPKSKVIVGLFFRFLENEFYPANQAIAPTQDISKKVEEEMEEDDDEDEDMEEDDDEEDDGGDEDDGDEEEEEEEEEETKEKKKEKKKNPLSKKPPRRKKQRPYNTILVAHLKLFTQFKDPRSLHGEGRLKALYHELLPHPSPEVQKVAFQCLLTYKNKALMPYKENIERLMDDKTFKNEVVLFSIDQDSNVLHANHRADVLPIVVPIIYGKMLKKTGKDTSGQRRANVRRSIVFRFLAGCQQSELQIFFDLIFKPVSHYIKDDITAMVEEAIENTDVLKVVPLQKQQSLLTTVDIILQKLGNLIDTYLPSILRVIVGLLAQVSHLLFNCDQLTKRAILLLKSVRLGVVTRLTQFYNTYRAYDFTVDEIQMIFKVAVWPQLELLPKYGVYSPNGLLNFFLTWSCNTRYFNMFRKRWSESDFCVMPIIISMLNMKNACPRVVETIMDIVYNLLCRHEEEEAERQIGGDEEQAMETETKEAECLDVGDVVEFDPQTKNLPLGVRILMPQVPQVLEYIHSVVNKMLKQKGRLQSMSQLVLNVLSRLSEYVTDSAQCDQMLSLLLPFLSRNLNRSVDVELSILKSIKHLIKFALKPISSVRAIAKLFSNMSNRASRSALCETLEAIGECEPSIKALSGVVSKMNAWDRRHVDEPEYLVRLEAYREAQTIITPLKGDIYITHMLVVIHNSTFVINTMADMSLRDSASSCIQQLLKDLAERAKEKGAEQIIINDALLPAIKAGMKLKSEVARHEYVTLLSHLIKVFPKVPLFIDLAHLADKDMEMDFFANMVHIQLHRRGRAMRRITRSLTQRPFMTETLVGYLLPLVTSYLHDEAYQKQAVMMDASIETIGSIAQCLPWQQYLTLLRYYLDQLPLSLDNQKLMVRVIVVILDSFHYDLKNSTEISETVLTAPGLSKVSKKSIAVGKVKKGTSKANAESEADAANDVAMTEEPEEEKTEENEVEEMKTTPSVYRFGTVKECATGMATRIHRMLIQVIIPQLHHSLSKKVKSDDEHKRASTGTYAEDEEVLRVPIALALVKLMQSLPHKTLDFNLPGLLFKLCVYLRSRALDIRNTARDTLVKIMKSLGPSYFSYILKELKFALKRGYQLHVLCFTTHVLLKTLENAFTTGDLETSIPMLVDIFNEEIFGSIAEEKNVIGITSKVMEAKSTKSYESYVILARFISRGSLVKVFSPLKSILETTSSHKTSSKVEDILHRLIPGLLSNSSLQLNDLMTFTFGLTTEVMPLVVPKKAKGRKGESTDGKRDERLPPTDTLIVQPLPKRAKVKAKTQLKTNMHILVEFGLQVLYTLLKHSTLNHKTLEHATMLDPFVPILSRCLKAKFAKVTSVSLRCLIWTFKFPLPSLKNNVRPIASSLFVLMKNYAVAGAASSGDNQELLDMCFKTVTVLVRDVEYYVIKTEELTVLLSYAEQDIHDHTRQATAFSILKAILSRKLVVPEMHDVMRKIEELSITGHDPVVRQHCRQVVVKFLLNYPLGAKIEHHLEFYVSQLEYEHDTGRESALEMLATMFEAFPTSVLHKYSGLFFVPLAGQMVNDDSVKCRKQTALAMKQLLTQLETHKRDELFAMVTEWFKDEKVALRKLASLTCGIMVEVEVAKFERHLAKVLPILEEQLRPEQHRFDEHAEERQVDHLLYGVLSLLTKLVKHCHLARSNKWVAQMSPIWGHVEQLLVYPHTWVRLASAELFGLLLSAWTPAEVAQQTTKESLPNRQFYLQANTINTLHDLCGTFCNQLSSSQLDPTLANQVLKNLVFLGKVLRLLPKSKDPQKNIENGNKKRIRQVTSKKDGKKNNSEEEEMDEPYDEEEDDDEVDDDEESKKTENDEERRVSFEWVLSKLCKEARKENANTPKETIKRTSVFKWLAAMALELGTKDLPEYLPRMLPVLVRELTDKSTNSDEALNKLAQEVINLMKMTAGTDVFTTHYAIVHKMLIERRQSRKRDRAAELIADPEFAAKRKMKKNLAKQVAKKRKIEDHRPVKAKKKHKPMNY